jgi:branched-chain amino acid transport system permease protein
VAGQFSFEAGLPIFLVAVVAGLSSVGAGLFTGTALIGPLNAMTEVAAGLQNFAALLPGLAGIGLGRSPAGIIPMMRAQWAPVARRTALAAGLAVLVAALWALRLAGVVNGWVLFWGSLVIAFAVQVYAKSRDQRALSGVIADGTAIVPGGAAIAAGGAAGPAGLAGPAGDREPDIPVEWRGLRRPWRPDDEEVLDRVIARG